MAPPYFHHIRGRSREDRRQQQASLLSSDRRACAQERQALVHCHPLDGAHKSAARLCRAALRPCACCAYSASASCRGELGSRERAAAASKKINKTNGTREEEARAGSPEEIDVPQIPAGPLIGCVRPPSENGGRNGSGNEVPEVFTPW